MKEMQRISRLFDQLYEGPAWIDVHIIPVLQEVSAAQAATRVLQNCNTIWEITNHMIGWRENILQRIEGTIVPAPHDNYFRPITDSSEAAWKNTLKKLEHTQQRWMVLLEKFNAANLDTKHASQDFTCYELAHGILQHDAYHLGQIVLLAKQFK